MLGYSTEVEGIGEVWIDTSYQNNMFSIGWGGNPNNSPQVYHQKNTVHLTFEGEWVAYRYSESESEREYLPDSEVSKLVKGLVAVPALRAKLEKWRKDALKRLRVSVPRLKEEFEWASTRLACLESASFA